MTTSRRSFANIRSDSQGWRRFQCKIRILQRANWNDVYANPHSGRIDALNLDNASLQPVWSAAERLNAAIFVHPWDMLGKQRMPKYWSPWLVGMPAETSLAICSMRFGGVFERFPKL